MNEQLVMNQLPFPKYFNGLQWNTVLLKSRKSIPKYLHQDLPKLKYQLLKQQFKEASKFQCPRLDYFKHFITHKCEKPSHKIENLQQKKIKRQKLALKQQLQYSILLNDRNSNVINQLLEKSDTLDKRISKSCTSPKCKMHSQTKITNEKDQISSRTQNIKTLASINFQNSISLDQTPLNSIQNEKSVQKQSCLLFQRRSKKRKGNRKYKQESNSGKYFDTISLVFQQRKQQLKKYINLNPEQRILPSIYNKVEQIKLLQVQN